MLGKRSVYASEWVGLELWKVRLPDGTVIPDHHVVDYPRAAVGVIPIADDGRVLLIEHYRFITDTLGWEVPSGVTDAGEAVLETARRELLEETGYVADRWQVLGWYHPSNGSSNQVFHLTVARGLTMHTEARDRNETLRLGWFSPGELRRLVVDNLIPDGMTVTAISWAALAGVLD